MTRTISANRSAAIVIAIPVRTCARVPDCGVLPPASPNGTCPPAAGSFAGSDVGVFGPMVVDVVVLVGPPMPPLPRPGRPVIGSDRPGVGSKRYQPTSPPSPPTG